MKSNIAVAILAGLTLGACAVAPNSASVYTARQAQNEQIVRLATVESVREVAIVKGNTGTGAMTGAALGGIAAGSNVGNGNGSAVAGIIGAVAGGIIGQHVEQNMQTRKGLEITVKLDNGEMRAITQDADEAFAPGERVRLLSSGHTTRVTH